MIKIGRKGLQINIEFLASCISRISHKKSHTVEFHFLLAYIVVFQIFYISVNEQPYKHIVF